MKHIRQLPAITDDAEEVYLMPGGFHFGGPRLRIRTVLGSCVSIVLWHPQKRIGGMCHYMMPSRGNSQHTDLDGRYADDAMRMILREIHKHHTFIRDYRVRIFGAGSMFNATPRSESLSNNLCRRNIEAGIKLLAQHGIQVALDHVGGCGHRSLLFDVDQGVVSVTHNKIPSSTHHNNLLEA